MLFLFIILSILFQKSLSIPKLIDLTHVLGPESLQYPFPGFEKFRLESIVEDYNSGGTWVALQKFYVHEHSGTHYDAPISFYELGLTLDEVPFERFFGPAVVIDIRDKVKNNDLYELSVQDVKDWVVRYGNFPNNSIVLINTGWESRWPNQEAFFGGSDPQTLRLPGPSLEAVQEIYKYRETHGIHVHTFGFDTPTTDNGELTTAPVHKFLAQKNLSIVVMLKNLHLLPHTGTRLMIMPMKIRGGTGAPARVVARIPY